MAYNKEDIDKQAEAEGRALRSSDQRQNVNYSRNRVKSESCDKNKFKKLFA